LGIFYQATDDAPVERLRTYTFAENIDTGEFSNVLSSLQEKETMNFERIIKIASSFFAKSITKIGGYTLAEIARRQLKTTPEIIENMYMADVITLVFGCRLAVVGSSAQFTDDLKPDQLSRTPFDYAVNTPCGCDRGETIKYDPRETNEYSLKNIEIKSALLTNKPIFEVVVPKGFSDGESTIKKIYMEPMKWYQLSKVATKKDKDQAYLLKQLIASIVAVPESKIYGIGKSNHPFCRELFNKMSMIDINTLNAALGKLQFGPESTMQVSCYHCDKVVPHLLPWAAMANFIYSSDSLTDAEI
jgi:hypothetical protein